MNLPRLFRHLMSPHWRVRRSFPPAALARIEQAIAQSETRHGGQIRFAVEHALDTASLLRGLAARQRALDVFSALKVWDTEHNNGVLIYLLLAEHAIEIVADRGLARHVDAAEWQRITATMSAAFRAGEFEAGLNQAIDAVDALLARHFALARGETNPNELSDAPYLR